MSTTLILEPLDVLYLRGNRLFEGAGAYGEALMPPWPSLAAGAIRSRILADEGVDFNSFAGGHRIKDAALDAALGTPDDPGCFRVAAFTVARRDRLGGYEACFPLPADVVVTDDRDLADAAYLLPRRLPVRTSAPLPKTPVLQAPGIGKPVSGLWLNGAGWKEWLNGERIAGHHVLRSSALWRIDPRLGIALNHGARTAASGMLYTAEAVASGEGVGFLVRIEGADGVLPTSGLLRLGGDGRGATVRTADTAWPEPDWCRIEQERRFRVVLTTPGILPDGWRLPGVDAAGWWHGPRGTRAKWVSAAVARAGVVSGWDLARRGPKTAERVAATGSIYWFEEFEGDVEGLRTLEAEGLWSCMKAEDSDPSRRAEGFNNVRIAAWPR